MNNKIVLIISSIILCVIVFTNKLNLFPTAKAATKDPLEKIKEDNKGIHSIPIEIILPEMEIKSSDKYDDEGDKVEETESEN